MDDKQEVDRAVRRNTRDGLLDEYEKGVELKEAKEKNKQDEGPGGGQMTNVEGAGRPLVETLAPIKRPWVPDDSEWHPYTGKKKYVIISAYITPGMVQSKVRPLLLTCKRTVGKSWEYTTPGKLVVGT